MSRDYRELEAHFDRKIARTEDVQMKCDVCGGKEWRPSAKPYNCPWCGEATMQPHVAPSGGLS